jgi:hypothetical protein
MYSVCAKRSHSVNEGSSLSCHNPQGSGFSTLPHTKYESLQKLQWQYSTHPMSNNRWEYYPSLPGFASPSDLQMTEAFLYAYWQNSSMMTKLKPSHVNRDAVYRTVTSQRHILHISTHYFASNHLDISIAIDAYLSYKKRVSSLKSNKFV